METREINGLAVRKLAIFTWKKRVEWQYFLKKKIILKELTFEFHERMFSISGTYYSPCIILKNIKLYNRLHSRSN